MKAEDIINEAALELQDTGFSRWSQADHYKFVLSGQRTLILLRPDANALTTSVALTGSSTRQALPADGLRLVDVVRNMGSDGATPGSVVTVTDRDNLDDVNASWHNDPPADEIDHFTFDDRNPTIFYVTPPPASGLQVEVVYGQAPTEVTAMDQDLDVLESFFDPLLAFQMYRAFRVNWQSAQDWAKARDYLRDFFLLIGEESRAKALYSPNNQFSFTQQAAQQEVMT